MRKIWKRLEKFFLKGPMIRLTAPQVTHWNTRSLTHRQFTNLIRRDCKTNERKEDLRINLSLFKSVDFGAWTPTGSRGSVLKGFGGS